MLVYLLPDKTTSSVKKVFDRLEEKISTLNFARHSLLSWPIEVLNFQNLMNLKAELITSSVHLYIIVIQWPHGKNLI